jgi:DNA-binding response OmpR family regulator
MLPSRTSVFYRAEGAFCCADDFSGWFSPVEGDTMKNPSVVLFYGHNELLLWTRKLLLEWAGYEVSVAQELRQVSCLLDRKHVDLIVLCYSLSRTECAMAGLIAKSRSEVPTLLMTEHGQTGNRDCDMREVADVCFDSMLGPEALIRKIDTILQIKRPRSFPTEIERRFASQVVA